MPHFFFDYHESERSTKDERGRDFPDRHTACEEALCSLPHVARTAFADGDGNQLCVVVRDHAGAVIFTGSLYRADVATWGDLAGLLPTPPATGRHILPLGGEYRAECV